MTSYKILLADDHKIVRDGIKALIEDEKNFNVVAEAENGLEAIELCKNIDIDIAIIDMNMPKMNGIELIVQLRKEYKNLKLLVLSMVNQHDIIKKSVESGVNGYLLKSSSSEELLTALQTIIDGGHYFCEESTKTIMEGLAGINPRKYTAIEEITVREREVLTLICKELTNAEIAERLNISIRTVDSHRRNLLQKIGAKNTAGLVKFAIKTGLSGDL
ncbi:MAG: response regulator transcription factor [Balneolaceae bacterium]